METFKGSSTTAVGVESPRDMEAPSRAGYAGPSAESEEYERARALFESLGDAAGVAQCDEARARTLVSEGKYEEAERLARSAVSALESSGGPQLLSESLTTLALAQASAGRHEEARATLARAVEAATEGRAATAPGSDSASVEERWAGFSLKTEVLRYEAELIQRALRDAGGGVSYAARLLGFRHHQTFVALLNNRHKNLLHARNPVVPRRRTTGARAHRAR
ncbi:MAG TPA: tetratricopeptide repeat protein [Pyrinomonadaceae bacterium]|jgi:tetratricopeptide (TPR) repeat protein|nr:tetratricopeptide repeat protein [Pyrinomonadaceae bacterium]